MKREAEDDYQVAAPTESRIPNLHRAKNRSQKSADGRATEAAWLNGKKRRRTHVKSKTLLTGIGLLMEGT
jgi:hypothetical protein